MSGQKKLKDSAPGWPSFPAKPTLPGLLDGLKVSQWWPAADLAAAQQPQLAWLVNWAATQVPHYEGTDWARPAARSLADALAREPGALPRPVAGTAPAHQAGPARPGQQAERAHAAARPAPARPAPHLGLHGHSRRSPQHRAHPDALGCADRAGAPVVAAGLHEAHGRDPLPQARRPREPTARCGAAGALRWRSSTAAAPPRPCTSASRWSSSPTGW